MSNLLCPDGVLIALILPAASHRLKESTLTPSRRAASFGLTYSEIGFSSTLFFTITCFPRFSYANLGIHWLKDLWLRMSARGNHSDHVIPRSLMWTAQLGQRYNGIREVQLNGMRMSADRLRQRLLLGRTRKAIAGSARSRTC
jgi:hypothetical protein